MSLPDQRRKWLPTAGFRQADPTLLAVSLGHGITHWYPGTFFVVLPYLSSDLRLSYSQVGLLMSWNYFTSFFVNLPGGAIVDMVGRTRLILAASLALTGIPYFFLGFSSSYAVAMIVITFVGIGNNLWHPAALSLLARRYPDRKGFALAFHAMAANLGDSVAPLGIGLALTFVTWRHVLVLNLVPGLLMGLVLWWLLLKAGMIQGGGKGKELSLKEYAAAVGTMFRNRNILLLCALSGFRAMTQAGLLTFLPIYLASELKYPPALVGTYLTVVQAAGVFASPLAGAVSDRKGRRPVLTGGLALTSVLLVLIAFMKLTFLFVAALALLGFFLFSLRPVIQAWAMDLSPKNVSGTTVSALFGVQSLFSSIAPAVCGFVADRFGILHSFYFLAFVMFAANFLVYFIPEKLADAEPTYVAAS